MRSTTKRNQSNQTIKHDCRRFTTRREGEGSVNFFQDRRHVYCELYRNNAQYAV